MRYSSTAISAALLLACVSPAAAEDEPRWSLSSSVNYSVGDYGTGKDTTFIYVPFTLGVKPIDRSEEHTSELQSHSDLVCRLLLEKKKVGGGGDAATTLLAVDEQRGGNGDG